MTMKPNQRGSQAGPLLALLILVAVASNGAMAQNAWQPVFRQFAAKAREAVIAAREAVRAQQQQQATPPEQVTVAVKTAVAPVAMDGPSSTRQEGRPKPAGIGKMPLRQRTTGKKETQAGCSCLASWTADAGGTKLKGCANPDNDPQGAWCPVSPGECVAYYSLYRTDKGHVQYFDYCSPVRERTSKGCLCLDEWKADGVGKGTYRNGCARPTGPDGKRVCKVDAATCPPGVEVEDYDECAEKQEPLVLQDEKTTWHNCSCIGSWSYKYGDSSTATFSTCANPDGDPLGAWCEVDPEKCDAATKVTKDGNKVVSIDYCQNIYKQPQPQACTARLQLGEQCGGKTNCTAASCLNAPWPGTCCPAASECKRLDAFMYRCQTSSAASPVSSDKTTSKDGGTAGSSSMPSQAGIDAAALAAAGGAAAGSNGSNGFLDKLEIASMGAAAAQEEAGDEDEDPAPIRLWVKAKVAMDYDALMSSTEQQDRFKSDIATWLRTTVNKPDDVMQTGVADLSRGSVVALAYVDFQPSTAQEIVMEAQEHLDANATPLYAGSSLPTEWGWLVSLKTGRVKEAVADKAEGPQPLGLTAALPNITSRRKAPRIPVGAAIAVAVCGSCLLLAVICAIAKRNTTSNKSRSLSSGGVANRGSSNGGAGGIAVEALAHAKKGLGAAGSKARYSDGSDWMSNGNESNQDEKHGAFWITNIASNAPNKPCAPKDQIAAVHGLPRLPLGQLAEAPGEAYNTSRVMEDEDQQRSSSDNSAAVRAPPTSPRLSLAPEPVASAAAAAAIAALAANGASPRKAAAAYARLTGGFNTAAAAQAGDGVMPIASPRSLMPPRPAGADLGLEPSMSSLYSKPSPGGLNRRSSSTVSAAAVASAAADCGRRLDLQGLRITVTPRGTEAAGGTAPAATGHLPPPQPPATAAAAAADAAAGLPAGFAALARRLEVAEHAGVSDAGATAASNSPHAAGVEAPGSPSGMAFIPAVRSPLQPCQTGSSAAIQSNARAVQVSTQLQLQGSNYGSSYHTAQLVTVDAPPEPANNCLSYSPFPGMAPAAAAAPAPAPVGPPGKLQTGAGGLCSSSPASSQAVSNLTTSNLEGLKTSHRRILSKLVGGASVTPLLTAAISRGGALFSLRGVTSEGGITSGLDSKLSTGGTSMAGCCDGCEEGGSAGGCSSVAYYSSGGECPVGNQGQR